MLRFVVVNANKRQRTETAGQGMLVRMKATMLVKQKIGKSKKM